MSDFSVYVFDLESDGHTFEEMANQNGETWWYYSDLLRALGYETVAKGPVNKAQKACLAIDVSIHDNFQQVTHRVGGRSIRDYKLSRFGCYLIAMNADSKKPEVARAQIYFIAFAEAVRHRLEEVENFERVMIREEMSEREKDLSRVAMKHGIEDFSYFQNAGYRGMYNRSLSDLKMSKGLTGKELKRSLLDFMGKDELAANLFRITQTELKIKNEQIHGQPHLEAAAETVGRQVRETMIDISGIAPEDLPLGEDIERVKRGMKDTQRKFKKIDRTAKPST